jgi:hypothetical protein
VDPSSLTPIDADLAQTLAAEARRRGLIQALREQQPNLEQLDSLLKDGASADDLATITVDELLDPQLPVLEIEAGESVEDAVMRVFRGRQAMCCRRA